MKIAPTLQTVELELISKDQSEPGTLHGSATWLAHGLEIEEAGISLIRDQQSCGNHPMELHQLTLAWRADCLSADIQRFLLGASAFLGDSMVTVAENGGDDGESEADHAEDEVVESGSIPHAITLILPLPLALGWSTCDTYGIGGLADQELCLQIGQANDALHAIHLALADKAILFRNDLCSAIGQAANTQAWGKLKIVDSILKRHAAIYKKCHRALVSLRADEDTLTKYQELMDADLKVTTSVLNPNGSGHRNENLAWFWSMDIPRDTQADDWMSECGDFLPDLFLY